jgi:hypothetical protein
VSQVLICFVHQQPTNTDDAAILLRQVAVEEELTIRSTTTTNAISPSGFCRDISVKPVWTPTFGVESRRDIDKVGFWTAEICDSSLGYEMGSHRVAKYPYRVCTVLLRVLASTKRGV